MKKEIRAKCPTCGVPKRMFGSMVSNRPLCGNRSCSSFGVPDAPTKATTSSAHCSCSPIRGEAQEYPCGHPNCYRLTTEQKKAAHTAGSWHLGPNGLDVRNEKEDNIVTLKYVDYISCETMESYARLIAAAPELLEELENLVFYISNDGIDVGTLNQQIKKARSAIAKATSQPS